jgi:hypothetical protein
MMMLTAFLSTLYFVASMAALWWAISVVRRQHDNDLRFHRDLLLHHIELELKAQERRLAEVFRQRNSPCSKG